MTERKFKDGETVVYLGFRFTIENAYYNRPGKTAYPGWYYNLDIEYQRVAEADLTQPSQEFYYPHSH